MGLTVQEISLQMVGESGAARLDSRFHFNRALVASFLEGLREITPLSALVESMSNGANLPRVAYSDEPDTGSLYASVGAFSSFVFRESAASGIQVDTDGLIFGSKLKLADIVLGEHEIVVTRSGTPGIAWPAALLPGGVDVVPSGFLIRARFSAPEMATYVAAILNHPVWRILSNGLSAGKRQDNLSQTQLGAIPIPALSSAARSEVSESYRDILRRVQAALDDDSAFTRVCDLILERILSLNLAPAVDGVVRTRQVTLGEIAETPGLRLDNRWHGVENRYVLTELAKTPYVRLGSLLSKPIQKGKQPSWPSPDEVDEGDGPFAVATITIQSGRVVDELLKHTTPESVDAFSVVSGDVLVAMDGEGSLGKAALYEQNSPGTLDSHVARCRLSSELPVARAIVCFLNSTWGRSQSDGRKSGSTGQTQLTPDDLAEFMIPHSLLENAEAISDAFVDILQTYEPATRRARRLLAMQAADTTDILVREGLLDEVASADFSEPDALLRTLNRLYPSLKQR